jgi:hypothetical protein
MNSTSWPYYASPDELPYVISTKEHIHNLEELLLDYGIRRKVIRVGSYFIVKYGHHVKLIEGWNLLFMSRLVDQ